ncbi:hypothetical protein KY289_030017 [Solanum tuberosum]|nr:hypothetical protein KY289_030017 [Solanum tuberosum]
MNQQTTSKNQLSENPSIHICILRNGRYREGRSHTFSRAANKTMTSSDSHKGAKHEQRKQ